MSLRRWSWKCIRVDQDLSWETMRVFEVNNLMVLCCVSKISFHLVHTMPGKTLVFSIEDGIIKKNKKNLPNTSAVVLVITRSTLTFTAFLISEMMDGIRLITWEYERFLEKESAMSFWPMSIMYNAFLKPLSSIKLPWPKTRQENLNQLCSLPIEMGQKEKKKK